MWSYIFNKTYGIPIVSLINTLMNRLIKLKMFKIDVNLKS